MQVGTQNTSPVQLLTAALRVVIWSWGAWWATRHLLAGPFWQVLVAMSWIAFPLIFQLLYVQIIAKTRRRESLLHTGWLYRVFSGRLISVVVAVTGGWVAAAYLLIRLATFSNRELLLFYSVVPGFVLCFACVRGWLQHQYKAYLVPYQALWLARLLTPLLLVLLYMALVPAMVMQPPDPPYPTLSELIEQSQAKLTLLQGSQALQQFGRIVMTGDALQMHLLSPVQEAGWVGMAAGLDLGLLLFLACASLSFLYLPFSEWRRLALPLTDAFPLRRLHTAELARVAAFSSFILMFILLPVSVWMEQQARVHPQFEQLTSRFVLHLEQIDEAWYRPGTSEKLMAARQQALSETGVAVALLQESVDAGFAAMESNIDPYLDWYYSLGGEYGRLFNLLSGDIDAYMAGKLVEILQRGDAFADVQQTLTLALARQSQASSRYQELARQILASNAVDPGDIPVAPLVQLSLAEVLDPPLHKELFNFQTRLASAGGAMAVAGVMSAAVATKISSQVLGKASFKLAAKSLSKLVASKAAGSTAGAGAGAVTGAAMGSVVPGIGTAIGAVIGGIVGGMMVGVAIDKAMLELEEEVNRDALHAEIAAGLHKARDDFRLNLMPAQ